MEGSGQEEEKGSAEDSELFLQLPGATAEEAASYGLDPASEARRQARLFGVLAGIKFGGIDAAGSLAASNSFSIFGKPVNYAFSLAYGPTDTGTGTGTGTGTPTGTGTLPGTFTGTANEASADNPSGDNTNKKKKKKNNNNKKKQPNKPKRKKKLTPQEKAQRQRKNFLEEHDKVVQRQNNRRG